MVYDFLDFCLDNWEIVLNCLQNTQLKLCHKKFSNESNIQNSREFEQDLSEISDQLIWTEQQNGTEKKDLLYCVERDLYGNLIFPKFFKQTIEVKTTHKRIYDCYHVKSGEREIGEGRTYRKQPGNEGVGQCGTYS